MKTMARRLVFFVVAFGFFPAIGGAAWAGNWAVPLALGSVGEAKAQGLPSVPTGATAVCTSLVGTTIKVTWNTVTLATGYSIYESRTSASSGYSVVASAVTGTSWTSLSLSTGTYWFEVAASIGTNWVGPTSAATAGHTIGVLACL